MTTMKNIQRKCYQSPSSEVYQFYDLEPLMMGTISTQKDPVSYAPQRQK